MPRSPQLAMMSVIVGLGVVATAAAAPKPTPDAPRAADASRAAETSDATERAPKPAVARDDDLVDVAAVIPDAILDMRYATADNFTGEVLYPVARCKLRRAAAQRLARAAKALRAQDRRIVLWDCYRPSSIQRELWRRVPDPRYVANPKVGSKHGRGAAVDIALADKAGALVALPTKFDDFTEAAHRAQALDDARGAAGAEARRLERAMVDAGWKPMPTEWWHFDAPDAAKYPLSDEPL